MTRPVEVFYSYAHEDEEYRAELEKHLKGLQRQGLIESWHDRRIEAGAAWSQEIDSHLESAQLILLLVSADFIDSDYCYEKEMERAVQRHDAGEAQVVPIIVRECDWQGTPLGRFQALPRDAKPIQMWEPRDAGFTDVAKRIRQLVDPTAEAGRLQAELRASLDRRELHRGETERRENEAQLASAVDDMHELQRLTGLGAESALVSGSRAEAGTFRLALGTLALAEEKYGDASSIITSQQTRAATEAAKAAIRTAETAIDEAVLVNMVRADADYGLGRWEEALASYKTIAELLASHPRSRVGDIGRDSLGHKLALCHFQRQLELQRAGGLLNKAKVFKHFALMKRAILEYRGQLRDEEVVRFGWEGVARQDGTPRPWVHGVYVAGNGTGIERRLDGDVAEMALRSDDSSFALCTLTNIELDRQPHLSWRWKATLLPEDGDLRNAATDDEAISLAVTFLDGAENWRHLYYGWDSNAPVGTVQGRRLPLPITALEFHNKVVTSGWEQVGEWVPVTVDVLEDIRRIIGCLEPIRVVMLAVQANSQHTHAKTEAWIGPLSFRREGAQLGFETPQIGQPPD